MEHTKEYWRIYDKTYALQAEKQKRHDYSDPIKQIELFGKLISDFTDEENEGFKAGEIDIDYLFELGYEGYPRSYYIDYI